MFAISNLNINIMQLTINQIPINWEGGNSSKFAKWFTDHVKSPLLITEDYNLIKN